MKFYNYLFPFIISCFFVSGSSAATGGDSYGPPGQKYTAHFGQRFASRPNDTYGDCVGTPDGECGNGTTCINDVSTGHNNRCLSCGDYYDGEYPYSDSLSVSYMACYKFCAPTSIPNGQIEPEFLTAYNPNDCKDKYVYCNNEMDKCNGYHAEGNTCVLNMQECTGDHGKGFKFWECNEDGTSCAWSDECLLTQCDDTYHLEPIETDPYGDLEYGFICNTDTIYGKCVSNTADCKNMLGDCKNSKGDGGEINGTAHWTTTGAEIEDAPGKWDFSQCSCTISNESIDGGIGGKQCWYTSSGAWGKSPVVWNTRCEITEAVSCDLGYCQPNGTTGCQKAPAGYFHDNTADFTCQPCPIGATSAVGATGIDRCFMQTGNTEFCDSVGCFKLPSNVPY